MNKLAEQKGRGMESPELNQNMCKNLTLDKNKVIKNQEIRGVHSTADGRKMVRIWNRLFQNLYSNKFQLVFLIIQ